LIGTGTRSARPSSAVRLPSWAVPWLLLAPAIAMSIFLVVLPYAVSFLYAFTNAQLSNITQFSGVGLSNFSALIHLSEPKFSMELITTFAFTGITVVGSLAVGTGLALAIYGLGARTRALLQALILVPWTIAAVITGYTWSFMYGAQIGFLNTLIERFGGSPVSWLLNRWLAIACLAVANVWTSFGIIFLIVTAALANVPETILRAAQVDGAGPMLTMRKVLLPNIRPALLLATLVAIVGGLNVFDLIFVITRGGPFYQTEPLSLLMYRLSFVEGDIGVGSAVTVILFVLTMVLAIAYVVAWQREARKWS
jgi:ABC-type sugar transport system permease subunit